MDTVTHREHRHSRKAKIGVDMKNPRRGKKTKEKLNNIQNKTDYLTIYKRFRNAFLKHKTYPRTFCERERPPSCLMRNQTKNKEKKETKEQIQQIPWP